MSIAKLVAGAPFPSVTVAKLGGGEIVIGSPANGHSWQMVIVYRGKHCPVCTRYLGTLNELLPKFHALGVDVVAVSADPAEKAEAHLAPIKPDYPVGYDLTVAQMRRLGVYVSDPRSAQETDRAFAEPGLFVINDKGQVQIIDISNAPFARPDLSSMVHGLEFIRNPEHKYPIRGTHR